jgi:hypothetical protein
VRAGGTVVLGANFSTLVSPKLANALFQDAFGVPWMFGTYCRTTHELNAQMNGALLARVDALPASYRMKAVSLWDVSRGDTAYDLTEPCGPGDGIAAPVVYARVGDGYLGWIGDVNAEKPPTNVTMVLLGLREARYLKPVYVIV